MLKCDIVHDLAHEVGAEPAGAQIVQISRADAVRVHDFCEVAQQHDHGVAVAANFDDELAARLVGVRVADDVLARLVDGDHDVAGDGVRAPATENRRSNGVADVLEPSGKRRDAHVQERFALGVDGVGRVRGACGAVFPHSRPPPSTPRMVTSSRRTRPP